MQSFPTELSSNNTTRLAGVLQLPDLNKMHHKLVLLDSQEHVLVWVNTSIQFHLKCTYRAGTVTYRLYATRAGATSLQLETTEQALATVYAMISAKSAELVQKEHLQPSKAAAAPLLDVTLTSAFRLDESDKDWISALATGTSAAAAQDATTAAMAARAFLQDIALYVASLIRLFNEVSTEAGCRVSLNEIHEVDEQISGREKQLVARCRASTLTYSLSFRVVDNLVEAFIVNAAESISLSNAETEAQREWLVACTATRDRAQAWRDGLPLSGGEMYVLVKNSFAKLIAKTMGEIVQRRQGKTINRIELPAAELEKHQLAQKIILQQEQLQRQIARDLHDAVIADVSMLRRGLVEGRADLTNEKIVSALDEVTARLREICYDLSPTELRDWGLASTLEALMEQAAERSGAECTYTCNGAIPEFEGNVETHIFRILQESVNNTIKHSQARKVSLLVEIREETELTFVLRDNGKGIDFTSAIKNAREGGMGTSTMQERVGLIRAYYPAVLTVRSVPGKGTMTKLTITMPKLRASD